jgi:uncharacterized membrane protein
MDVLPICLTLQSKLIIKETYFYSHWMTEITLLIITSLKLNNQEIWEMKNRYKTDRLLYLYHN